ncbi:DUF1127 domain-containing protein [Mesorhizobium sp. ORS 3428]|uniref:DUF1127 domain-containing protein n=1 Tax=Mesorhizobium sp. ORS 3428 TaxID=540997 RepID=UPI0008DA909F|nr:DUF1127 domain-containing protein [Mesorhizobium sp. ORS 3428]OHV86491.1 hypothetical protein ORS3428_23795 [Mesorhizobium sp. ORS 3428]
MSILARTAYETRRPGFSLSGFAGRALGLALHAMRMRSQRAALHAMPDYLLKDLGISRSQIEHYTSVRLMPSDTDGMDA